MGNGKIFGGFTGGLNDILVESTGVMEKGLTVDDFTWKLAVGSVDSGRTIFRSLMIPISAWEEGTGQRRRDN